MSSEAFKVEAKWQARPESPRSCAQRLAHMLAGLAAAHPAFDRWNKLANSRAAADRSAWRMPPDTDELTAVFEGGRQYKDMPRKPWPELGYSVGAWNGMDPPCGASLSIRPGRYSDSRAFPNSVDLELNPTSPRNADLVCAGVLKPALLSIIAAWEPDYGVVICWDYWQRLFGDRRWPPFRSGWITYLAPRYASRVTPPPAAIVEPVPGGGLLLLATDEQFSMDNPVHLAAADAIQAALAPLQGLLMPSHEAPFPHNPAS